MADLRELYLEMVTDHAKNPRHRGKADPVIALAMATIHFVVIKLSSP